MGLNKLDFAIIALYLIGITLFGLRFRKKQRTLRDYFLAGRDIPWWAIALDRRGRNQYTHHHRGYADSATGAPDAALEQVIRTDLARDLRQ